MKTSGSGFRLATVAAGMALLAAFAYVEYRGRNPEWQSYQRKGIALTIAHLEKNLADEPRLAQKRQILAQIEILRNKPPKVIEISPFGGKLPPERCMSCHFGIEDVSESHPNSVFGCVTCHGGNAADLTVRGAHLGLRGGRNPARLDLAPVGCGSSAPGAGTCHSGRVNPLLNRVENVPKSLMATNAGIISILRFQWGLEKDNNPRFAIRSVSDGKTSLAAVPPEINRRGDLDLASSQFQKFCAACHLWNSRYRKKMGRMEGCPACHAPYGKEGHYVGCDPTVKRDEVGHPATHTITNKIPDDRCRACHNRSARVGLSYHGQMESTQYGTPFVHGGLNDETLSDNRFIWNLVPDIHHEKGMACIDCHAGQDTMGDGKIYAHIEDQVEIRCEDCHGSYSTPPRTMTVDNNNPLVRTLIRASPLLKLADGDVILQTSKERPMPHVRLTEKGWRLTDKLTGKGHSVSIITGRKNGHTIYGHKRLECDTCHSAWSPQCYGCHQVLDLGSKGLDHISGNMTKGRWAEGRGFFRFERNIYGINSRGKVGILVPGCQVWNTVIDAGGKVVPPYDSKIMKLKNGLSSIAMGPTHPHTVRKEVPRCVDCHSDPKALGLGDGILTWNSKTKSMELLSIYDSKSSGLRIRFPVDAIVDSSGSVQQSTSHKLSRGFNKEEIRRIVSIAPCLPCHDRYDDPVWQRSGPYKETAACRKALGKMGR